MKYVECFGPLALAIATLMVFAGTAAATTITSSEGSTPNLIAAAEGHVIIDNPIAKIECASALEANIESHGPGVDAAGQVDALSFTGCTNDWHVTVISKGTLRFLGIAGQWATVFSSGTVVDTTRFGITCKYKTANTDTGLYTSGNPAVMHISAAIPFYTGSFLCGSGATTMTGSYRFYSPLSSGVDV